MKVEKLIGGVLRRKGFKGRVIKKKIVDDKVPEREREKRKR